MVKPNKRNIIVGGAVLVVVLGFLIIRNMPVLKYFARKAKIAMFQRGVVSGDNLSILPAVYHKQEHALSCEIAALKMALSVFAVNVSEAELIEKLEFDPTTKTRRTWGNPYEGFVGNIDGKMMKSGYGVYWEPIAEVAREYMSAEVKQFNARLLAEEVENGHPVVTWGYFGRGKKVLWTTPDGENIYAINGEHARTVIGFTGPSSNPSQFIVLDPIYGEMVWEAGDLLRNGEPFNNMGVVVYPKLTI